MSANPTMLERIAKVETFIESAGGVEMNKYALGPWSSSKLKMAEKCPFQFYLQYVLKIKPDPDHVQDTELADVGTTCHKILEYVVMGHDIPEAFRLAKRDHCEVEDNKPGNANISQALWDEKVVNTEASIIAFKERLDAFARNNNIKEKLTELRLGVTKDWKPTGFFSKDVYFRGIIDLILFMDNGPGQPDDALIIDHKTGGGEFSNSLKNYDQQLNTYKPLVHYGLRKVAGSQSGINFIRAQKLIMGEYDDASEIETVHVRKLEWLLSAAVDRIKELGYFKHVRGSHCVYCVFNEKCKSGELKPVELGTKKWFAIKEEK